MGVLEFIIILGILFTGYTVYVFGVSRDEFIDNKQKILKGLLMISLFASIAIMVVYNLIGTFGLALGAAFLMMGFIMENILFPVIGVQKEIEQNQNVNVKRLLLNFGLMAIIYLILYYLQ